MMPSSTADRPKLVEVGERDEGILHDWQAGKEDEKKDKQREGQQMICGRMASW